MQRIENVKEIMMADANAIDPNQVAAAADATSPLRHSPIANPGPWIAPLLSHWAPPMPRRILPHRSVIEMHAAKCTMKFLD